MPKKYQVFISSTYEDLKDERDQVIKACLEMGHIPVGMEMFSAADDEQWMIIKRQIDEVDYYVVCVAHRYGSLDPSGVSYSEKEYDYAKSANVPIMGFVINDNAPWPETKRDKDSSKKELLDAFKLKIKSRMVNFWSNKEDLHAKFSIALMKSIANNPRPGWDRADELIGANVTRELTRLSKENSELRSKIEKLKASQHTDPTGDIVRALENNKISVFIRFSDSVNWEDTKKLNRLY